MKLYISENLKRLRQSRDLTQEQLADMLGVSFQSVSRWEIGMSYPDIELIPEIAAFFDVTTDALMGVEKATMEKKLAEDMKILRTRDFETLEEELAFTRELHRKYPHDAEIIIHLIYNLSGFPEHTDEMRRLIRTYIDHPDAEKVYIDQVIRLLVASEKEEDLPAALEKYAAEEDMSRAALLYYRAWHRDEREKSRAYRQLRLRSQISRFFHTLSPVGITPPFFDWSPDSERTVRLKLAVINMLTGTEGMDFVAGDGEPDLWFEERRAYGFHLAGNYALAGKTKEAFAVLESVVGLYEKFYSLPEGTTLTFRCPELSELRVTFRCGRRNPDDVQDFSQNLYRCMREEGTFYGVDMMYDRPNGDEEFDHYVMCPAWDIVPLTDTEEWSCFGGIREDERFQNLIRRMEKFIIPVDAD